MISAPLVSIIIPTYNRAHFIKETLDCVLEQTYQNWECIVVDDGSNDNTYEVLDEYLKRDVRVQFYQRPSYRVKGASSCRNIGLEVSKGEYIQFLDSDDIISSNKLEVQLGILLEENKATCAICKWGTFKEDTAKSVVKESLAYYRNWHSSIDFFNILGKYGLYVPIHSYLISRDLVVNAGKWNEDLSINDDGEFFTRLLLKTDKIIFTEDAVVYYRKNNENGLSSYNKEKLKKLKFSWQLIESHLRLHYMGGKIQFVQSAKKRIFDQIKVQFPLFIIKNFWFFRESIAQYYLKRIKYKLKIYFK